MKIKMLRAQNYSSNVLCKNFYLDPISSKVSKDWEN